jgi:hypothetical protein
VETVVPLMDTGVRLMTIALLAVRLNSVRVLKASAAAVRVAMGRARIVVQDGKCLLRLWI